MAVEDDPVAQMVLEAALKSLGHEVVLAVDGPSAWAALQDGSVQVVVSDWLLPGFDGLDLCRLLRARGGDYVYFILLSKQSATEQNEDLASEAGVDDLLQKPLNTRDLKSRLRVAQRILGFTQQVMQLESILPVCSYCKSIRDDENYWQRIEVYLTKQTGSQISHGIFPSCYASKVQPELDNMGIKSTVPNVERVKRPRPIAGAGDQISGP
jgi:DNA-binding response OmpR family regulator